MLHIFESIIEKIKAHKKGPGSDPRMVQRYRMIHRETTHSHRLKKPRTALFVTVVIVSILLAIHGIVTEFSG